MRTRDFGDEAVRIEPAEQPSDLARVLVFVWCKGISGEPEFLSHITVREAVQGVFPRKEHLKEHALVARQRIERSDRPAVLGRCVGRQRIEIPHGGSGILYLAQGVQVSDVALGRGLFDIGTTTSRSFVGEPMPLRHGPGGVLAGAPGIPRGY